MGLFNRKIEQPEDTLARKRTERKELDNEIAALEQTVEAIRRTNELADQVRERQSELYLDVKAMEDKHD